MKQLYKGASVFYCPKKSIKHLLAVSIALAAGSSGSVFARNDIGGSIISVTGDGNVAHGYNVKVNGNNSAAWGVDIEVNADNSITLGIGSTNNRDNAVSFGTADNNRQLTNVGAGSEATDGVNLQQMRDADEATLSQSTSYTDAREVSIRKDVYDGDMSTLNQSNSYTDQRFNDYQGILDDAMDSAYSYMRKENAQMRQEYRAIGALAMATAAIGLGPKEMGRSQIGMAVGSVQSASAIAVGLNHYINDSTALTFRGALGTSSSVSGVSAGFVKGW